MNSKKILLPAFILISLFHLFVPAKMIWDREKILQTGKEFKFRSAPIDPSDPFRGKYITLNFNQSSFLVENEKEWERGERIYVHLSTDQDGFAAVQHVSKEKPIDPQPYLKSKVRSISRNNTHLLRIEFPFTRYYMEESRAYAAEQMYRESQWDSNQVTYALVCIENGEAVLKDVRIDGIPIIELVKKNKEEKNE